jgi:hypothetical protein
MGLGFRVPGSKRHRIPDPDPQHSLVPVFHMVESNAKGVLSSNLKPVVEPGSIEVNFRPLRNTNLRNHKDHLCILKKP